jgi:hypothetical protein
MQALAESQLARLEADGKPNKVSEAQVQNFLDKFIRPAIWKRQVSSRMRSRE